MRKPELPMTVAEASRIALGSPNGRLGETTKMPGYSFGISSSKCQRGRKLARNLETVCGHCYTGVAFLHYYKEVQIAHERRWAGLTHPDWVPAMITLLRHYVKPEVPYFRWFDSGDLQGVWMLKNIVAVCLGTPDIHHFLPTHEPYQVRDYLKLVAKGEAPPFPPNLCLRVSADLIGQPPKRIAGIEQLPTSTVHRGHGHWNQPIVEGTTICQAYTNAKSAQGSGQCGDCRACWDASAPNISYGLHNERAADYSLRLPFQEPVIPNLPTLVKSDHQSGRTYSRAKKKALAKAQSRLPGIE